MIIPIKAGKLHIHSSILANVHCLAIIRAKQGTHNTTTNWLGYACMYTLHSILVQNLTLFFMFLECPADLKLNAICRVLPHH